MKILTHLLLISIILLTAGCAGEREKKPVRVAVSLAGDNTVFTALLIRGLTDAADSNHLQLDWKIAYGAPDQQLENVDELLRTSPDVIIIEYIDPHEGGELSQKIIAAGSRIIAFNRPPSRSQVDIFVSSDYRMIGAQIAEISLADREGDSLHIVVFAGHDNFTSDSLIANGILEILRDRAEPTTITIEPTKSRRTGESFDQIINLYRRMEKPIDIILCVSDRITKGVIEGTMAMIAAGRLPAHSRPVIAGIDYGEDPPSEHLEIITVDRLPYTAGIKLAETAAKLGRGEIRHVEGTVFQSGDYIFPVLYTPHKIIRK
jgi:ABC-type sugar transport system substrate-binding protein